MIAKTPPPVTGTIKSRAAAGAGEAKAASDAPSKKGQAAHGDKRTPKI